MVQLQPQGLSLPIRLLQLPAGLVQRHLQRGLLFLRTAPGAGRGGS